MINKFLSQNKTNKGERTILDKFILSDKLVGDIEKNLDLDNRTEVLLIAEKLHVADVAELIKKIKPEYKKSLIDLLRVSLNPEVLSKLDDSTLNTVIQQIGSKKTAEALEGLDTDEAIEVLDDLDTQVQKELLSKMDESRRKLIQESLNYPEDSAGRLMQRDHLAISTDWDVGRVIDYLREAENLPDEFYELLVVDSNYYPLGTVPLNNLLKSNRPTPIFELMKPLRKLITVNMDQEEVAYIFQKYDLVSAPVIDGNNKLIGVIMHDDVVDVITEEAEDDILRLARAGEAGINDTFFVITKNRFVWLSVNLITAIIASYVIYLFDATIEQLVALAVLMPIVASMGGNAGTQTLTVTVRAIATKDITYSNAIRFINKELLVSLFNGTIFALIISLAAWTWFSNVGLAFVIFAAMIINMVAAGISGIVIPLGLNKIGADPALAATVFVTTVTDVIGFFAFLGLAALVLI